MLLREVDARIGLMPRLANCLVDYRNPKSVEHPVQTLLSQRIYGLALGYEDLNDHDVLRSDSLLALLVGKSDVTGQERVRERDQGCPLASSSTLNWLELSQPDSAAHSRYKQIAADPLELDRLLVDIFMESYRKPPREIWLDLDATDDPLHGHQEGYYFHAIGRQLREARDIHRRTGNPARRFRDFHYRTRKSWSRFRRVVGKAEYLTKGANPRFVVTNLPSNRAGAKRLYEKLYCARGDM